MRACAWPTCCPEPSHARVDRGRPHPVAPDGAIVDRYERVAGADRRSVRGARQHRRRTGRDPRWLPRGGDRRRSERLGHRRLLPWEHRSGPARPVRPGTSTGLVGQDHERRGVAQPRRREGGRDAARSRRRAQLVGESLARRLRGRRPAGLRRRRSDVQPGRRALAESDRARPAAGKQRISAGARGVGRASLAASRRHEPGPCEDASCARRRRRDRRAGGQGRHRDRPWAGVPAPRVGAQREKARRAHGPRGTARGILPRPRVDSRALRVGRIASICACHRSV